MKYSFLIFDADGTLFDFDRAEAKALANTCRAFGLKEYSESAYLSEYRKINAIIWTEFEEEKITAGELKTERFRRFFLPFGLDFDPEEFSTTYLTNLSKQGFLLDGAEELLETIGTTHTMALLTNGLTTVQYPRYNNSILPRFISHIVVSEKVGVAKPNAKIFEILFREAGWTDKSSALMIGDNLNSDIKGGINFGIDTCWYNPAKRKNTRGIRPTYTIESLKDLLSILNTGT